MSNSCTVAAAAVIISSFYQFNRWFWPKLKWHQDLIEIHIGIICIRIEHLASHRMNAIFGHTRSQQVRKHQTGFWWYAQLSYISISTEHHLWSEIYIYIYSKFYDAKNVLFILVGRRRFVLFLCKFRFLFCIKFACMFAHFFLFNWLVNVDARNGATRAKCDTKFMNCSRRRRWIA